MLCFGTVMAKYNNQMTFLLGGSYMSDITQTVDQMISKEIAKEYAMAVPANRVERFGRDSGS